MAQDADPPIAIARERNRILRALAANKNLEFRQSVVGRMIEAITLNRTDTDTTEALSDNFLKLTIEGSHAPNQWLKLRVQSVTEHGLLGELLK